ncbi:NAD(P)H-dependent oxidoreductase [Campylobacter fetus]|uniref:FMN dependent NADH:quinone oxidoreductase n=3 Tax=Campylobacter fetus TaxID=196 RepID=A0AAE6IZI3_CAMFE|nr:NAD(P)H-dependent oxidoreductase [Campylobacter fetus]OCS21775.1 ACP phosphodiesterase [Campylobacter fetus subsp. venerealis cfvi97/532]OCS25965.1 ACP phosphodiesterase [Campylobacter fetus subsp. venerealis cfvB10]OCS28961.1 ACP phosphodiesterase [Campylobacter fetus subsp. venerealis LMG 6570 = CCUG 33900]OCS40835.1 ACP phosphodiesterase [Campylobacter fetus subsp. venerealis cfvi02/298]ABK83178.1 acyl carrier protein phosphodiesterase [Campylobacter fetus subsp. fetus 82-40]
MKTLLINAHPKFDEKDTFSYSLQSKFKNKFENEFDTNSLCSINLYNSAIPKLDRDMLNLFQNQQNDELQTQMNSIMEQFLSSKRIVIVMPLHNFNIPARLKDYMDNILIAKKTFAYTSGGSIGLMNDDRKVLVLCSSGSVYTDGGRYANLDFACQYLKAMFCEIMGFNNFYIVRAEGTSMSKFSKDSILSKAYLDLDKTFAEFYKLS